MGIFLTKRIGRGVYASARGKDVFIVLLIAFLLGLACLGWIIEFIANWWGLLLATFCVWIAWIIYTVRRDAAQEVQVDQ